MESDANPRHWKKQLRAPAEFSDLNFADFTAARACGRMQQRRCNRDYYPFRNALRRRQSP